MLNETRKKSFQPLLESDRISWWDRPSFNHAFVTLNKAGFSYSDYFYLYETLVDNKHVIYDGSHFTALCNALIKLKEAHLLHENHRASYQALFRTSFYAHRLPEIFDALSKAGFCFQNDSTLYQIVLENLIHADTLSEGFILLKNAGIPYYGHEKHYKSMISLPYQLTVMDRYRAHQQALNIAIKCHSPQAVRSTLTALIGLLKQFNYNGDNEKIIQSIQKSLFLAVEESDLETFKALLTEPTILKQAADKETLQSIVEKCNSFNIIEHLLQVGIIKPNDEHVVNFFFTAVMHGNLETVRLLLDKNLENAFVDTVDHYGLTALMHAAEHGQTDVVRLLLEKGAMIDTLHHDTGMTALMLAARYGHADVVRLLLQKGAMIETVSNINCMTALMYAARLGHSAIIRILLAHKSLEERKMLLSQTNDEDQNAIAIAFAERRYTAAAVLLEFGAEVPANAQMPVVPSLNNAQNTHTASVHASVSRCLFALAVRYLPNLEPIKKECTEVSNYMLLARWLRTDDAEKYLTSRSELLLKFADTLKVSDCQFDDKEDPYKDLKINAARRSIRRIIDRKEHGDFRESQSGVPILLALALAWDAVQDTKNPDLLISTIPEKNFILVEMLYQIQRGYNIDVDGNDNGLEDDFICLSGHFNKMMEALSGRHPLVFIEIVTEETARLRLYALIQEIYIRHIPDYIRNIPLEQLQVYSENMKDGSVLPPDLWSAYLKTPVLEEFYKEYQPHIDSGIITVSEVQRAILAASCFDLPQNVIDNMLIPMEKAMLEATLFSAAEPVIIDRYHLTPEKNENYQNINIFSSKKRSREEDEAPPNQPPRKK